MFANSYFSTSHNANVITRTALSLAIVQRHALDIGPQADLTIDKAVVGGRTYSDKAPGLSLMATPAAAAAAAALDPEGQGAAWLNPDGTLSIRYFLVSYLCSLCTVSLLSACATTALYVACRARGITAGGALFAAATLGFATPFWGFSTVLFGHAAAGALLLLGFLALSSRIGQAGSAAQAAGAGLLLGTAFAVEFPAGPAVAIIGLSCFAASMLRPGRLAAIRATFIPAAAGVALAILPVLAYNQLAFGSPTELGYGNVQGFEGMKSGFMGVALPDPKIAYIILFSLYRGLLPLSPILVAIPFAAAAAWRRPGWRLPAVVGILVFAYYLCLNAGYYYWDGGASTGPRHVIASLPLLCLPLAVLWDAARGARRALAVLLAVSILVSLVSVSVDTLAPQYYLRPFVDYLLPRFLAGDINRAVLRHVTGLPGPALLALFVIPAALLAWLLVRATARERPTGPSQLA